MLRSPHCAQKQLSYLSRLSVSLTLSLLSLSPRSLSCLHIHTTSASASKEALTQGKSSIDFLGGRLLGFLLFW